MINNHKGLSADSLDPCECWSLHIYIYPTITAILMCNWHFTVVVGLCDVGLCYFLYILHNGGM